MVERRFTVPANSSAFPNRLVGIPPSKDGMVTIPLGRVNDVEGDKYMVFGGDGVTANSEPILSAVFVEQKDFEPDANNPNNGFLKLGGVTTDISYSGIEGSPVVMMLEVKPQQKLDFIPDGVRLVGKDGSTQPSGSSYSNESDKPETIILYFPQETHGYVPRGGMEAGDIVQLKRNVALTNPGEISKMRGAAKRFVTSEIAKEMRADSSMKRPDKAEIEARQNAVIDAEVESRFEVAEQTVERMREMINDKDASLDFGKTEKNQIETEIKRFEKNKKDLEADRKKAQLKNKNVLLEPNQTFDAILESGGFRNPIATPSTLAVNATGLPDDIRGKLAKKESGMALGISDTKA